MRAQTLFPVLLLSALTTAACGKAPEKEAPAAGCTKDTDCKGDRVCAAGTCQDAPATGKSAAAAATSAPAAATSAPAAPSPGGNGFRAVPESEWKPVVGPRLRVGAVVVHQVFEGPLGPSPKSLFVVTREGKDFYATVWADGHGYRNGPLANNGGQAAKIPAVSFFDADGDGTMDALVLATYTPAGGGADGYDNVLLRWKGTALLRMTNLEKEISGLETVAAVRAKLKK